MQGRGGGKEWWRCEGVVKIWQESGRRGIAPRFIFAVRVLVSLSLSPSRLPSSESIWLVRGTQKPPPPRAPPSTPPFLFLVAVSTRPRRRYQSCRVEREQICQCVWTRRVNICWLLDAAAQPGEWSQRARLSSSIVCDRCFASTPPDRNLTCDCATRAASGCGH